MSSKSKLQDVISGMMAAGSVKGPKMPKSKTKIKSKIKKY